MSLPTSWYMRMRLCDVMARQVRTFRGGEGTSVQVDEPCVDESLKGRHHDGLMPRGPTATAASAAAGGSPSSRSASSAASTTSGVFSQA